MELNLLGDGVYDLNKGYGSWKPADGDVLKVRIGGLVRETTTAQKLVRDAVANVCLPPSLERDRLLTIYVDYHGWYEDRGQHCLCKEVLRVVQKMSVGQKVLIVEEKEDENPRDENPQDEKEDLGKETRIWVVHVLQVLRIRAGWLNFGENDGHYDTTPRDPQGLQGKPKLVKRAVRQRVRRDFDEPRVKRRVIKSWVCGVMNSKNGS